MVQIEEIARISIGRPDVLIVRESMGGRLILEFHHMANDPPACTLLLTMRPRELLLNLTEALHYPVDNMRQAFVGENYRGLIIVEIRDGQPIYLLTVSITGNSSHESFTIGGLDTETIRELLAKIGRLPSFAGTNVLTD